MTDDPEIKCYLPEILRATYMPFPSQIVPTPDYILMAYEFASASRTVYMKGKTPSSADSWMGHSIGHWDDNTWVIDVNGFNDQAFQHEATIEDSKVFSRPWNPNALDSWKN